MNLAYSPDGSRLAIAHDADRGNVVSVFDSESRRVVAKMMPPPGRFIVALRYSADGRTLDTIGVPHDPDSGPSLLTRFDTRSGRRVFGPKPINRSASSPLLGAGDAAQVVTAGKNEVTPPRCRDTARSEEALAVPGTGSVTPDAYALSPDGHTLAIGDDDGAVRFLDIRTGAFAGCFRTAQRPGLGGRLQLRRPHARHRRRWRPQLSSGTSSGHRPARS